MIPILLLETGKGAVGGEDVRLSVSDPDATTLLINIIDVDVVDIEAVELLVGKGVTLILELEVGFTEVPPGGSMLLVAFEVGKGGRLEAAKLDEPEPAGKDAIVDADASVLPVPLGTP